MSSSHGQHQERPQASSASRAPQQQQQQQQLQLQPDVRESSAGPSSGGLDNSGEPQSATSKSPLHLGLGFLKGLGDKRNKDGQAPKRRGPKPDSKPALTRRQELNRQAQRTHRERKEFYIKSLEHEVMQLKEVYSGSVQEKNSVMDENRKLRELLRLHGIPFDEQSLSQGQDPLAAFTPGQSSSGYPLQSGSSFSPPAHYHSTETSPGLFDTTEYPETQFQGHGRQQSPQGSDLDYDQLGVNFVLALEEACMDHLQYMCVQAEVDPEWPPCGHAMMLSCPPPSHFEQHPDVIYPNKAPDLPNPELMKLLMFSHNLPLDGYTEITPIIALRILRDDPRYPLLVPADYEVLKNELKSKVRCYGFGAVLEAFELRDALNAVFSAKPEGFIGGR